MLNNVELQSVQSFVPLSSHSAAMLVYNTAANGVSPDNVSPGLYYNDGAAWQRLEGFDPEIGDIKNSVETTDHNGWYLLNGRMVSTLPAVAITNAASLALGANLPDASNRIMKGKSGAETFAEAGGSTSFVILQTNLPAITYTGNTSSAGAHSHGYTDRGATIYHGSSGTAATGLNGANNLTRTTGSAGAHAHSVSVSSGGVIHL